MSVKVVKMHYQFSREAACIWFQTLEVELDHQWKRDTEDDSLTVHKNAALSIF